MACGTDRSRCLRTADTRGIGRGGGRGQEALEVGEVFDGIDLARARGHVVGDRGELAARGLVPFLLKALAGDPHLDVVGLGGEDQQRLVLCLPAEPADRSIVAVPVGTAADAEGLLARRVGVLIGQDRAIENLLDQPGAKGWCGNPDDEVLVRALGRKVLLPDVAASGLRVPGDHEEGVDHAVARPVGMVPEASFPDRAVPCDERWHDIARESECFRHAKQGVHRRARPADGRLGMAARTPHEVEAWANTIGNPLFLREVCQPHDEHLRLIVGEAVNGPARSRSSPPEPGVAGAEGLRLESLSQPAY